jgi:molybdopterin synthase catalytic subunit
VWDERVLSSLEQIAREALGRFGASRAYVVHRSGRVDVGEASVVVAVSAPHRAEAFNACRFVIDTLKATAPIWKKEVTEVGEHWVGSP